jgi:RNA polymerase primary sigma factor
LRLALDDITKLIDAGKEKYLTYNEVNGLISHDVHSPEALDDLLTTIGTQGIDVLDGRPKLPSALEKKLENEVEASDEVELNLAADALEKTNDPVRIYLREMGVVPLLTREREMNVAKRIELGQLRTLKALSRSPIVVEERAKITLMKHACPPSNSSTAQAVRIVVKYLRDNPERLHMPASVLVTDAIRSSFPCK